MTRRDWLDFIAHLVLVVAVNVWFWSWLGGDAWPIVISCVVGFVLGRYVHWVGHASLFRGDFLRFRDGLNLTWRTGPVYRWWGRFEVTLWWRWHTTARFIAWRGFRPVSETLRGTVSTEHS